jgi:hypothetical protein
LTNTSALRYISGVTMSNTEKTYYMRLNRQGFNHNSGLIRITRPSGALDTVLFESDVSWADPELRESNYGECVYLGSVEVSEREFGYHKALATSYRDLGEEVLTKTFCKLLVKNKEEDLVG